MAPPIGCENMLTLYSYPQLCGVADNNGYGLKVFAFIKLTEVPFIHEHTFDASAAPRGQLPYITDDGEVLGDSETIIAHLLHKYRLPIDDQLTNAQRHIHSLVIRMLDDLYWVMSYSRWDLRLLVSDRTTHPECRGDHRAGDRYPLASSGLPLALALEISSTSR
jgi:hypothetical protein